MTKLRILSSALVILGFTSLIQGAPNSKDNMKSVNLTTITWDHAVNTHAKLQKALKSKIEMIEADVLIGDFVNEKNETIAKPVPIMAHPPSTQSDLSLETFLGNISEHNKANPQSNKGVKLDFKDIESYEKSKDILTEFTKKIPKLWLNADIVKGPGSLEADKPVDDKKFLQQAKLIGEKNILSIGWTTGWNKTVAKNLKYSKDDVNAMENVIKENQINNRSLTFPVRAVYAANSKVELNELLLQINKTNEATLTIWSANGDEVDTKKLTDLILNVGVNRVYLDLPDEVHSKLRLNSSGIIKSSFINYAIISILMILISQYIKQ